MTHKARRLSDSEIYEKAGNLITTINKEINESIYKDLKGSIELAWSADPVYNASASSMGNISEPPRHKICLNYHLVLQTYRDAEAFYVFAKNIQHQPDIMSILDDIVNIPLLPNSFTEQDCIENMFISSLTWIYFHELGHLWQEHGYIRDNYTTRGQQTINECVVNSMNTISGKEAAISHVTELSADFHATTQYVYELVRHFNVHNYENTESGELFIDAIYLSVCGLSIIFNRFYNYDSTTIQEQDTPTGSHPPPLLRLGYILPHLCERLSFQCVKELTGHSLNRRQVLDLCTRAAFSGSFAWMLQLENRPASISTLSLIMKSNLLTPASKLYAKSIVAAWDEIEPTIRNNLRHELPLSILSFSKSFRNVMNN